MDIESAPLVRVYGMATLEHYKVSILGAADASALLNWLHKNGYRVDPEEYIETCIRKTIGRKGRGLVVMWRGIPDFYEYEEIIDELMKIPFPKGKGVYLTRLEARMDRIRFPLLIIQ